MLTSGYFVVVSMENDLYSACRLWLMVELLVVFWSIGFGRCARCVSKVVECGDAEITRETKPGYSLFVRLHTVDLDEATHGTR
jgi:hypothetical protein